MVIHMTLTITHVAPVTIDRNDIPQTVSGYFHLTNDGTPWYPTLIDQDGAELEDLSEAEIDDSLEQVKAAIAECGLDNLKIKTGRKDHPLAVDEDSEYEAWRQRMIDEGEK